MRTFKKSSTAIITTLALGLLPALPVAAQTALAAPAAQTYTVRASQAESGAPGAEMTFSVVQKPGADSGEVIITCVEEPEANAEREKSHVYTSMIEYNVETAKSNAAGIQ